MCTCSCLYPCLAYAKIEIARTSSGFNLLMTCVSLFTVVLQRPVSRWCSSWNSLFLARSMKSNMHNKPSQTIVRFNALYYLPFVEIICGSFSGLAVYHLSFLAACNIAVVDIRERHSASVGTSGADIPACLHICVFVHLYITVHLCMSVCIHNE